MTWRPPITLEDLPRVNPVIRPWMQPTMTPLAWFLMRNADMQVEGLDEVADNALLAMNHTHLYDWIPIRWALARLGRRMCTFTKPRSYTGKMLGAFLHTSGNIPLGSRGYVISADFRVLIGRAPTEEEYRDLRDWVDGKADAPAPLGDMRKILETPRSVLDYPFDPATQTYAEMVNEVFARMGRGAADLARTALDGGVSAVITPQGVFSSRLTPGRIGGVQFAAAIGVPMVPVGLSGMNEVFADGMRARQPRLHFRVGSPIEIQLPDDHVAFEKASEDRNRAVLESETQRVMEAINELLEPAYQWDEDSAGDGVKGVARFLE